MITPRYFIIYKPFGMLSQFSKEGDHKTLANLNYSFPKDVYPVGRLDVDSEGLLLLTNNKQINNLLLDPKHKHSRTYLAQVEGVISDEAKSKLEKGVSITVDGKEYKTLPSKANLIPSPEENGQIASRNPPIRFRKNIPTTWIELELQEGKNRQVRKMTAAVGFPTLRLIRVSIEKIKIEKMKPSEVKEIKKGEINFLLNF
jgi:23S rRNA pseudouridine2457 synthase